jgi:DNA-binding MarR family transcriptional regulator
MSPDAAPRPCACTSVRRVARVLARAYDSALSQSGLNITQLAVMRTVLRHPDEPLTRVADDLAMDRTSLYRALALLRKNHWVALDLGSDERSRRASVTAEGQKILARADQSWAAAQTVIVERFGAAKWPSFVADLRRLADCAAQIPLDPPALGAGS